MKELILIAHQKKSFWMGTAVFITSLALNVVSPLTVTASIILTSIIVTFYTVLGGIKAVVLVDAIQSIVMFLGVIAISIKTSMDVGGSSAAWNRTKESGRDTFLTFDPDPTLDYSAWTISVGLGVAWVQYYCGNQALTQRFQSCKDVTQGRIACVISLLVSMFLLMTCSVCGCLMYIYFEGCDPFKSKQIEFKDQMIPFLVLNVFKNFPGISGLFVSAAYSGMLSTVSSGMNSLSTLILEDLIRPIAPPLNENLSFRISQLLGILLGITVMAASFLCAKYGELALVMINTLDSGFGGPMVGLFTCGIFLPWVNRIGGLTGLGTGVVFNLWIFIGKKVYGDSPNAVRALPSFTDKCPKGLMNITMNSTTAVYESTTATFTAIRPPIADNFYAISYLYLSLIGFTVTIVVALCVSYITGFRDPKTSDPAFFLPIVDSKIFPKSVISFFRFGVPEYLETNSNYYLENLSEKADRREPEVQLDLLDKKSSAVEEKILYR